MEIQNSLFDEDFLKKMEYLYIMSKKAFVGVHKAERKTKKVASGIEFADHRNYAPGDDFKHLDWKIYGRTEKLLLRQFEEEEDLTYHFLLDCSASMNMGNMGNMGSMGNLGASLSKLDYAKRLTAALAYIALCNMDRVCFSPFNTKTLERMAPMRGKGQIFKVFSLLNKIQPQGLTQMQDAFKSFAAQNKRRGVAVVVSDFYNPEGFEKALNILHYQQFETYVIQIIDNRELYPEMLGEFEIIDCETQTRQLLTITPKLLARYRKAHEALCNAIESYCYKRKMLYFKTPIQTPFDEIIMKVFRQGGFIK